MTASFEINTIIAKKYVILNWGQRNNWLAVKPRHYKRRCLTERQTVTSSPIVGLFFSLQTPSMSDQSSNNKSNIAPTSSSSRSNSSSGTLSSNSRTSNAPISRQTSAELLKPKKEYKLMPENEDHNFSAKLDCCAFIVHCATHQTILLRRDDFKSRWMPFCLLPHDQSWKDGALAGFCLTLAASDKSKFNVLKAAPPFESFKCMQVLRLQLPQTQKFTTRLVYYFKLDSTATNFTCCQDIAPHLEWFSLDAILANKVPPMWGPELVEHCKRISERIQQQIVEFRFVHNLKLFIGC